MVAYVDSSVILAPLLGQKQDPRVTELLAASSRRIASDLLRFECVNVLCRAARIGDEGESWLKGRIVALDEFFSDINFRALDRSVEEVMRNTPRLAESRTLDSIHLATALCLRPQTNGDIQVVSYDARMRRTARQLGLKAFPA